MPAVKVSESISSGFDMPEGRTRIVGAEWAIHQGEPAKSGENKGTRPEPCTCLVVTSVRINDEGQAITEPFTQALRCTLKATTNVFHPSEDGELSSGSTPGSSGPFLIPVGADPAMNDICGAYMFLASMRKAGFKTEEMEHPNPISAINGTEGTIQHEKRDGFDKAGKATKFTTPLMTQITYFPYDHKGEATGASVAVPVKGKPGPKPKTAQITPPQAAPAAQAAPVAATSNGFDATSHYQAALIGVCESERASGKDVKAGILLAKSKAAAIKTLHDGEQIKAIHALIPTYAEMESQGEQLGLFVLDSGNVVWV